MAYSSSSVNEKLESRLQYQSKKAECRRHRFISSATPSRTHSYSTRILMQDVAPEAASNHNTPRTPTFGAKKM